MPNKTMCADKTRAKANRERVANDEGGAWWREQARAIAQWQEGEPKPASIVLGELPYVGKINRRVTDRELDTE